MNVQYEITDTLCICNLFPPDWVGSSIQVVVTLADFETEDLAKAEALKEAQQRYENL